jgi:glycosyltransferase involved in cell wall biosynthesis
MKSEKNQDSNNTVMYFGTYEKNYPRNRIMIKGLQRNDIEVIECHLPLWEKSEDKTGKFFKSKTKIILNLIKNYSKLIKIYKKSKKSDTIIVGYPGQFDMILARILAPRKKIIFNPMISMYDTIVLDRKLFKKKSIPAKLTLILDKLSCKLANKVILDTPEHARYFEKEIKVNKKKLRVVPVGADDDIFTPLKVEKNDEINILFYGKFTPIHGIEYILKAAKILETNPKIKFTIIGKGQTHKKILELYNQLNLKNIKFIDWVPYDKLPIEINKSDICLGGHFGLGDKAGRVIPNKTFQMIATKKPVIVSNSIASKEGGLINNKNSLFCERGNTKEIVDKINKLIQDKKLSQDISENGYNIYKEKYSIDAIGKKTKELI